MQDKQHEPTERQRDKFREEGEVARSQDLNRFAVMAGGVGALVVLGSNATGNMVNFARARFGSLATGIDAGVMHDGAGTYLRSAGPVLAATVVAAVAVGLMQTRGLVTFRALQPKLEKLNPLPRLGKMVGSAEAALNLLLAIAKVAVVGVICGATLYQQVPSLLATQGSSLGGALHASSGVLVSLLLRAGAALLVLALVDFWVNHLRLEKKMRMTTQQVRDEMKEQTGDPQVRSQRRRRQRDLVQQRSIKEVPNADVVLVNPTHYAVALAYDSEKSPAPRVVAKGADLMAEKIRSVARHNSVPVVSNPPLTRKLYAEVKVGRDIPEDLYHAVAVVLAHVFRKRRSRS